MEASVNGKRGPKPANLEGRVFGRLTAKSYDGRQRWVCECECGNVKIAPAPDLKRGRIRSCGCLHREIVKSGDCRRTHGGTGTPEYRSWTSMLRRCSDPKAVGYHRYGGRGIKVCERWQKFENFLEDMGSRPEGTTLDRYPDQDGNYEPSNCRWATYSEQAENMSTTVLITANGKCQSVSAWARELGVSSRAIHYRLSRMTPEEAINRPFRAHKTW